MRPRSYYVARVMMRSILVLALALPVLGVAAASSAAAPAAGAATPAGGITSPHAPMLLAQAARPMQEPAATEEPSRRAPSKPSGFWGSTRPAKGGAYRYRLLGIGVGVVLLTAAIVLWILRRPARRATPGGRS